MNEAPHVPLESIAKILAGQSPPSETYWREPIGLPFFQGKADFGSTHPIARTWCSEPYRVAQPGDILMSVRAPVGPTNVADVECCIGRGLAAIRCGASVNRDYLLHYFRHIERRLVAKGSGSTFGAISRSDLESLLIPLPSLADQIQIAGHLGLALSAASTARRAAEERRAAAEALNGAIYREVFGRLPPLYAGPLQPNEPSVAGWRWRLLTDVARLATGHTPSRRQAEYWAGDIPWIQLPDIRALDGRTAMATSESVAVAGIQNSAAVLLPAGTVCLSRTASIGFVTIMGREMATSQDFVNWVCGPELDPHFLMHLLIASRESIRALGSGAIHHTVYFPSVQSFRVCLPNIDKQRQIVTTLTSHLSGADQILARTAEELRLVAAVPAVSLRAVFGEGLE